MLWSVVSSQSDSVRKWKSANELNFGLFHKNLGGVG